MGATLYGARLWQSDGNEPELRYDALGKNSEVFAQNDIVSFSAGEILVATTAIVGVVVKTDTMTATNTTVAKVYPGFIPIYDDQLWLMGTNSDLSNNHTNAGTYYTITGATGAQQVKVSVGVTTTTDRVVEIVKVDPYNEGGSGAGSGLRKCVVRILKTPYTNITAT
jgi:hypothetical protein